MPPPEQQIAHASAGSCASASSCLCPVVSVIAPPNPLNDQPQSHEREQADCHANRPLAHLALDSTSTRTPGPAVCSSRLLGHFLASPGNADLPSCGRRKLRSEWPRKRLASWHLDTAAYPLVPLGEGYASATGTATTSPIGQGD